MEADIKGFFDNISHEWMMRMLAERIEDGAFLRLIGLATGKLFLIVIIHCPLLQL